MNEAELSKIIREVVRAVLKERGIEVVPNTAGPSAPLSTQNKGARSLSRFELASLEMNGDVQPNLAAAPLASTLPANTMAPTNFAPVPAPNTTPVPTPNTAPPARFIVAVCCGECLNENASAATAQLEKNGFALTRPAAEELKKPASREALLSTHEALILPSVGDDDAAKMASGIFDEPVTRTALAALSVGKPVYIVMHAPYAEALRRTSPNIGRLHEGHRRALQNLGFNVVEAAALPDILRARFGGKTNVSTQETVKASGGKKLITAQDVETAAQNGTALDLANAIITPLARDRARELNFAL